MGPGQPWTTTPEYGRSPSHARCGAGAKAFEVEAIEVYMVKRDFKKARTVPRVLGSTFHSEGLGVELGPAF